MMGKKVIPPKRGIAIACILRKSGISNNRFLWLININRGMMKNVSKFLMVTALAAIGLNTSLTDFKKAGLKPMFYGVTIDTLVTLTALAVIWCMGLM